MRYPQLLFPKLFKSSPLKEVGHYTRFISRLKYSVIVMAVLLVLVIVIFPIMSPEKNRFQITFDSLEVREVDKPRMVNPRFHGIDPDGQPYNVVAKEAVRQNEEDVLLSEMKGHMDLSEGGWLEMVSQTGNLNVKEEKVDLNGNVNVYSDDGYVFSTQSMHIDLKEAMAAGNEAVNVKGPFGTLDAKGFIIRDNGDKILFHGGVDLIIYPEGI